MLIDTHNAVKKFISAGIPENHAEAITEVISNIDSQVATKSDIESLRSEMNMLKWMLGIVCAMTIMIFSLLVTKF